MVCKGSDDMRKHATTKAIHLRYYCGQSLDASFVILVDWVSRFIPMRVNMPHRAETLLEWDLKTLRVRYGNPRCFEHRWDVGHELGSSTNWVPLQEKPKDLWAKESASQCGLIVVFTVCRVGSERQVGLLHSEYGVWNGTNIQKIVCQVKKLIIVESP